MGLENNLDISIVIPCYESEWLVKCLESIRSIKAKEIIVVDSSPEPLIDESKCQNLRYFHIKNKLLPGAARNFGAQKALSRWILFIDSDISIPSLTADYINNFKFNDISKIVFGPYIADKKQQNFFTYLQNSILCYRFLTNYNIANIPTVQSSHFIISSEAFKFIGGFDENLSFREDHNFCVISQKLGYKICVDPHLRAYHLRRFNFISLIFDYFYRSFKATTTRLRWPLLFGGENLSLTLLSSWLLGCLLPVVLILLSLSTLKLEFAVFLFSLIFLAPIVLVRPIYKYLNSIETIKALCLWPFAGLALACGVICGYLKHFAVLSKVFVRKIIDGFILFKRIIIRNGQPVAIIHFLNSTCNLRCHHCFYKSTLDNKKNYVIDLNRINKLSQEMGPLLWYSVGGGEPILRKDLSSALSLISKNSRPWILSIPTNGWYTNETYTFLRRFVEENPQQRVMLNVSIDGPPAVHDFIRGSQSWSRAHQTFMRLLELQKIYPQISLGIILVVSEENAHVFPGYIDELMDQFKPQQIAINIKRDTQNIQHTEFVLKAHQSAIERYEKICRQSKIRKTHFIAQRLLRAREYVKNKSVALVAAENQFITPCLSGNLIYTIWEDGRISPCEIRSEVLGNVFTDSFKKSVRSLFAQKTRSEIVENKCKCTYECAMSLNAMFSLPLAFKTLKTSLKAYENDHETLF